VSKWILMILLLALAACVPAGGTLDGLVEPTQAVASPSPSAELPVEATETIVQPCGYQWAYQSLPEVDSQFRQALDAVGMDAVKVRAEAFGENCVNADGSVQRFVPMQTDLYLQAGLADLSPETIGNQVEQIIAVLQQIPIETLPGPGSASAYLSFEFTAGQQSIRFRVQRPQVMAALQAGKHGANLYNALAP